MLKDIQKNLDLGLVIILTLLCIPFVLIPPLNETPIRIILGVPLVLFLPGYSLVATLFPGKEDLNGLERVALSYGLSIAIVPLLGFALNFTPFGIRLSPVLLLLSIFTVSFAICAYVRRSKISVDNRFAVDFNEFRDFLLAQVFFSKKKKCIDKILTTILIISIILAISITAYVIITPKGETFTEFYVLGPGGKAEEYPTNLHVGEEGEVIIGIVGHEYATVKYQLEVKFNGEIIHRESTTLVHNETWKHPIMFKAMKAGEDQKLEFLLYKNHFNKNGKEDNEEPYRYLYLWVDVKEYK